MKNMNLTPVFVGHAVNSPRVDLQVGRFKIYGTSTSLIDVSIPQVVLLTPDSYSFKQTVDYHATEKFLEAVNTLLVTGQSFCTVLRPDWSVPAMLWNVSYNNELIVRRTGDAENDPEGGYIYLFDVILCDINQEKGQLIWDVSPIIQSASIRSGSKYIAKPKINHVRDYSTVGEDVIDLLHERGVKIIYLPEIIAG